MCDLHDHDKADEPVTINSFVDELVVALTNSRIYWQEHPRVRASLESLAEILPAYLDKNEMQHLELGVADGHLFHQRRPLLGASLSAPRIIEPLVKLDSGGFRIRRGATPDHMLALVEILSGKESCEHFVEANDALDAKGCRTITLLPTYGSDKEGDSPLGYKGGGLRGEKRFDIEVDSTPLKLHQGMVTSLQDVMVRASRGDAFMIDKARGHVEAVLSQLTQDAKTMMNMCRYERYDAFTFGHSIRVCSLALYFGHALTNDTRLLHRVGTAALLHDVGKAWVPFDILYAKGRLTSDERKEMDKHTTYGSDILLGMDDSDPIAVATAFGHHKRAQPDGGPTGRNVTPLSAVTRIVKICDVYEALTAVRPYKDRMSSIRAFRIMLSMQGHFDPALLRRFIYVNGIYPVGSRVLLNNGEIGRVHAQGGKLDTPVIDLEVSREGDELAQQDQRRIDLGKLSSADEGLRVEEGLMDDGIESQVLSA